MSCIFIRPVLPHGYLPSTNLSYPLATNYDSCDTWTTADIVDADNLQRNWATILSKVNGLLDGTDFMSTSGQFDEETAMVDYEGGTTGVWPTVGQRHSHDGIDSSKLADHTVAQLTLGLGADSWGSFGIIRFPSESYYGVLMTSVVAVDQPAPEAGVPYAEAVSVPYDHKRWGEDYLQRSGAAGRTALIVCPLMTGYPGWTVNQKCAPSMLSTAYNLVGGDIRDLFVKMQDLMGERVETNWSYSIMALACIAI